jgi:hypothetical protein
MALRPVWLPRRVGTAGSARDWVDEARTRADIGLGWAHPGA